MSRTRLLVADAPGGPHPSLYLPSLLREFTVDVVWLDVEPPAARTLRQAAVQAAADAGGTVTAVTDPSAIHDAVARVQQSGGAEGIVAFSERVVHTAQALAWAAGLSANPPEALRILQDKRLQRRALASGGLVTPSVRELRTETDVARAVREAAFPAVLKPAVGMGSIAVFRVEQAADLAPAWHRARALVDSDLRIAHHAPALLLEEELVGDPAAAHDGLGDYLSVEALVVSGEPHVLAVSDKLPLSSPFRENGHVLPALRPAEEYADAVAVVTHAHRALGITFGATHTEVKLTPNGPVVIEVNGRVGGSVPEQLRLAADYDLPLNLARLSVGRPAELVVAFRRWAAYLTPQPPEGRRVVEAAPTAPELRSLPGIASVHHVAAVGAVLDSADGTASNLLRVVATADSPSQIFDLAAGLGEPGAFSTRPADPIRRNYA